MENNNLSKDLVVYKNLLNKFSFDGELSECEQLILFNFFKEAKDQENKLINLSYKNFKHFIDNLVKRISCTNFENILLKLTDLNAKSVHRSAKESYGHGFSFFDHIYFNRRKDLIEVQLSDSSMFFFNNISTEFTKLNLKKFSKIKSTYLRIIYKNLLAFAATGEFIINYGEFKDTLRIPTTYRAKDIQKRILDKAEKELSIYFNNLKITKIKDKKSNQINTLVFTFDKKPISQLQIKKYKKYQELSILEKNYYNSTDYETYEIEEVEEVTEKILKQYGKPFGELKKQEQQEQQEQEEEQEEIFTATKKV